MLKTETVIDLVQGVITGKEIAHVGILSTSKKRTLGCQNFEMDYEVIEALLNCVSPKIFVHLFDSSVHEIFKRKFQGKIYRYSSLDAVSLSNVDVLLNLSASSVDAVLWNPVDFQKLFV